MHFSGPLKLQLDSCKWRQWGHPFHTTPPPPAPHAFDSSLLPPHYYNNFLPQLLSFPEDTKLGFEEKKMTEYIYLLGKRNVLMVIRQVSMVSNLTKAI